MLSHITYTDNWFGLLLFVLGFLAGTVVASVAFRYRNSPSHRAMGVSTPRD